MRNKKIKLKLIIIFALIVIFSFKSEFILISKAREERSYDSVLYSYFIFESANNGTAWLLSNVSNNVDKYKYFRSRLENDIRLMTPEELADNYTEYHDELMEEHSYVSDFNTATLPNTLLNYLNVLIEEMERVEFFNSIYSQVDSIDKSVYSEDNISFLQEQIDVLYEEWGEENRTFHEANVSQYLEGALVTSFSGDSTVEGQLQEAREYILEQISIITSHIYDYSTGEIVEVPISIDTGMYDPSNNPIDSEDWSLAKNKVGYVLGAIRNISIVVAVISLMIIGIKYIFGSVEEKANYKQTLWPYFIGILLVTSGTVIVSAIYNAIN